MNNKYICVKTHIDPVYTFVGETIFGIEFPYQYMAILAGWIEC